MTFAQQSFTVMDWSSSGSLHDYLLQKAHRQYDERRTRFNKATISTQSVITYGKAARSACLRLLGQMPVGGALNPVITGIVKQEGYSIEKVVYESFPQHHVTANVYRPERKGVYPAIVFLCGHEDPAKFTPSYQQTASLLAKNGFVVLVIDPLGQGERLQVTTAEQSRHERPGKKEHTLLNETSNLFGTSTPAYQVWDNKRGLDYLITRPDVDSARIGCIGNSGGGMQAIYFAAFEKRIKAIAVCSYLSSRERMYDIDGPTDGCVELPNEGVALMEMSDYLAAAAPTPLLILAGRFDSIDFIGTLSACNELKQLYTAIGSPERFKLFAYDDGHGLSLPKREAAASWFKKWLYHDSTFRRETPIPILSPEQLQATSTGQVSTTYPNEISVAQKNQALFEETAPHRKQFLQQPRTSIVKGIQALLRLQTVHTPVHVEYKPAYTQQGITYNKAILRREGQLPLPVLIVQPTVQPVGTLIWLHDGGKRKIADSTSLLQQYASQGYITLICDISGTGELEDPASLNETRYYNKEYRNATIALHIGSSLVAQRVTDMINLLDFATADSTMQSLPVTMHATGLLTLPALHTLVLDNRIKQLYLYNGLSSYKDILQKPTALNWYSYVITGVLNYYDIPDLITLAPPGTIHMNN
ncbi:hypothetical protein A4H97_18235 [Niastella yeongjuensis]|uniref:Acetyl xylan esterase domain-containing protein n=2 Tax=Niastella yeongjuensis TaxID=354355 RepID=A0A1V9DXU4_9BACT|nr:hypothetical protein A4H97_18235 [Niastella yeongjuensis]